MATDHPAYDDLARAYRDLLRSALQVNDMLRVGHDHVTYEGSMNDALDLREEVNRHLHDWIDFIYPESR